MSNTTLIHNEKPGLETHTCNAYECRKRLMNGDRLTHDSFIKDVGCHRLATYIHVLINPIYCWNWNVSRDWIKVYNPITQRMDKRKEYWLEPSEIERIKKAQAESLR